MAGLSACGPRERYQAGLIITGDDLQSSAGRLLMSEAKPDSSVQPRRLPYHVDWIILAVILLGFVWVTAQRLGTVPLPETDEAYTLQVPYEMLFRGKLA